MKGLLGNAASKAWVGVGAIGALMVLIVLGLALIGRLGAGQDVIDAAGPALSDQQVAGERAGARFIAGYVDLADPLITARGGGAREAPDLIRLIARYSRLRNGQARIVLRRQAPHTEALLRALPLGDITRELPSLQSLLARMLSMSRADVQTTLAANVPHLTRMLAAIVPVANGWDDLPQPFQRFGGTPVRTMAQLRDYLSGDLVAAVRRSASDFQAAEGSGGIGYIPWLALIVGLFLLVFGLRQAKRAQTSAPGRRGWAVVVGVGAFVVALVLVAAYVPRLSAAQRAVSTLKPAFTQERVAGLREGIDLVQQAIGFGDPIATARGGGAGEVPKLLRFISERTGLTEGRVLDRLRRRVPHLTALLEAAPLQTVGDEVPQLMVFLSKRLKLGPSRLLLTLRKFTPRLAQALERATGVTASWNAIPGTERLARFDGSPVRTASALGEYLHSDVVPVLDAQRDHFETFADTWPPLTLLAPLLLALGVLTLGYGLFGLYARAR